ncbi:MAG: iron-sulfur cluster assembly scaffold protein [Patescibacteria group bacterium]
MDIFSEIILDHYKHPHNNGRLSDATHCATVFNPLCGDSITLDARIDECGRIEEVRFQSKGCAISTAAMSMLTDIAQGKEKKDIELMNIEDIQGILGVDLSPSRIKCALLGQEALVRAFETRI